MVTGPAAAEARTRLLALFRWHGGHADLWPVFAEPRAGCRRRGTGGALSHLSADCSDWDRVAGAFCSGRQWRSKLGVGFVAVRKGNALFPGPKLHRRSGPDYRGLEHDMFIRRDTLKEGDRAILVDDWAQTGCQALAVTDMVRELGADLIGISLMVDELEAAARSRLPPTVALILATELASSPSSGGTG